MLFKTKATFWFIGVVSLIAGWGMWKVEAERIKHQTWIESIANPPQEETVAPNDTIVDSIIFESEREQ